MSGRMCDRAALVEAMFDGRLGPSEQASTERHLNSCSSCTELLRDLTSLQEMLRSSPVALSPLEHQRARLALLRQTAAPFAVKRRRPVALLVAALVTLPLAVWAATSSLSPLRGWGRALVPAAQTAPTTPAMVGRPVPNEVKRVPNEPMSVPSPIAPSSGMAAPSTAMRAAPRLSSSTSNGPRRARVGIGDKIAATASSAEVSQASRDFAEAMKALSRGDFSAGASKLEGFVSAHPDDPRVEDAAYLEAIALERAGRLEGAKAAARSYLAAYPEGAHHVQARRIARE